MKRLVAAAGIALCAALASGDPSKPAPHTVSLPATINADKPDARDALKSAIDDFFQSKLRRLKPASSNTDYSYFTFDVSARGKLTSSFGAKNEQAAAFGDGCSSCDMDEKLSSIVEKTLFKHARLYTDVALRDCSANSARTRVTITVAPNNAGGIEPNFYYRARLVDSDSETDVTLSPFDNNEIDDASATFDIRGTAVDEFLLKCTLKKWSDFVLVPHASSPVDSRTTNPNASSATRK
jgi:hypothetical protein